MISYTHMIDCIRQLNNAINFFQKMDKTEKTANIIRILICAQRILE